MANLLEKEFLKGEKKVVSHDLYSTVSCGNDLTFFMIIAILSIISRNYSAEEVYDIYQENVF